MVLYMADEAHKRLASLLTAALTERGMSKREVARRAGLHEVSVYRIFGGEQGVRRETIERICEVLGVDPTEPLLAAGYVPISVKSVHEVKLDPALTSIDPNAEITYEPDEDRLAELWAFFEGVPPTVQKEVLDKLRTEYLRHKTKGVIGRRAE